MSQDWHDRLAVPQAAPLPTTTTPSSLLLSSQQQQQPNNASNDNYIDDDKQSNDSFFDKRSHSRHAEMNDSHLVDELCQAILKRHSLLTQLYSLQTVSGTDAIILDWEPNAEPNPLELAVFVKDRDLFTRSGVPIDRAIANNHASQDSSNSNNHRGTMNSTPSANNNNDIMQ